MENMTESFVKMDIQFSKEELDEIKAARKKPIMFDEDCPETTPERALRFRRVNHPKEAVGK